LKIFLNPNHAFLDQRETKQKKIKSRGVHIWANGHICKYEHMPYLLCLDCWKTILNST
jgi:hypothetical protein